MTQYNSVNVKLSNGTDAVLRRSSKMIGNSDDEITFPHKLLLS